MKMKTIEDVIKALIHMKGLMYERTFGSLFLKLTDQGEQLSPEDYFALYLVAIKKSIPETVLLRDQYPAVEHIRFLPLIDQEKYIVCEEPFDCLVKLQSGEYVTQKRIYKQLSEEDCKQLFMPDNAELGRRMVQVLHHPDSDDSIALKK